MKNKTKKWACLIGSLIAMFGFTSCGSSQKSAGESPVQKQMNPNERLVGNADGSVYREVREVVAFKLSPANPVGNLLPTTDYRILRDQKWNLYNFVDGVITPRAIPIYGWKRVERVSPATKKSTKTQSSSVSTKKAEVSRSLKKVPAKKVEVALTKKEFPVEGDSVDTLRYMTSEEIVAEQKKTSSYYHVND